VRILLLSLLLAVMTVAVHSIGTNLAISSCKGWLGSQATRTQMAITGVMGYLVGFLLIVHFVEAALWAVAMLWWAEMPDFSTAIYYSMTSYSTVGYGDVLLPESTRLLGPIESVLGVMMMGWSTAVIVTVVQRLFSDPSHSLPVPLEGTGPLINTPTKRAQQPAGPRGA
jgi:hypothetical protein